MIGCQMPHLEAETLERAFIEAFNRILVDKERYISDNDAIVQMLTDTAALDKEAATLEEEVVEVYELFRAGMEENARVEQDQEKYRLQVDKLDERYIAAKKRVDAIDGEKRDRMARREKMSRFLAEFQQRKGLLTVFDEGIWRATVESVIVQPEAKAVFTFKDGSEGSAAI